MASNDDGQDLVVYGTPIEREEDVSARKRRGVAEAGQLRTLPAWKQEVPPPTHLTQSPRTPSIRMFVLLSIRLINC
jgi:hypothetical protein